MKILIADKLDKSAVTSLEELGATVIFNPDLKTENIPEHISDVEILVVRSTKVNRKIIEAAPMLALIIRAGAGVNTIDIEAANERGIHVANCPGKNTDAVAELAIGLMIAADRRIVNACTELRNGKWNKKEYQKSNGLKKRTLGIIGFGSIGQAVARRAKALEMNVVAYDIMLTAEKADEMDIGHCRSLLELATLSDVVSVHVAATPETKHFINQDFFDKLKAGAVFVNAARGEVVDTKALKKAIKEKNIRAAIDVYENEPAGGVNDFNDTELAEMATCTPHIGASTGQAAEAIAKEVVRIVKTYNETGKPVNAVNIRYKSETGNNIVVRHYNHVGVLAGVLDILKDAGINVEDMENTIFSGGKAASCSLKLDGIPSDAIMKKISDNDDIIQVMVK